MNHCLRLAVSLLLCLLCILPASAERLLVVSDPHMQAPGESFAAVHAALLEAAQAQDVLLFLGDNTNNAHLEEHELVLARLDELADRSGAEVYAIPGNHDYSLAFGTDDFRAAYVAHRAGDVISEDEGSASLALRTEGGTYLLLLDTNRWEGKSVTADGGISEESLRWVERVLGSLPPDAPVIACGHHPILPAAREQRTPGATALAETLRRYGVTLYLCGHDHGFGTVAEAGLRQITVGQPQAYPGWAGSVEVSEGRFRWHVQPLYAEDSATYRFLRTSAETLAASMARGTLAPTVHADDEEAIDWFTRVFMAQVHGELTTERCDALLNEPGCAKWREIETKTVVKAWILSLLENCPESVLALGEPARLPANP